MPIIKLKDNESFDSGLRRFKRSCDKAGIISEIRKRLDRMIKCLKKPILDEDDILHQKRK